MEVSTINEQLSLCGKRALVTGGSRGIGLAIARILASAGAEVIILARGQAGLQQAQAELARQGHTVKTVAHDLTQFNQMSEVYCRVVEEAGAIDILVNNAGVTRRGPAETIALADWQQVLDTNLTGLFVLSQVFAAERIASRKPGKIVNIASLLSRVVRKDNAPYAAAKGGVLQLTKAMAVLAQDRPC